MTRTGVGSVDEAAGEAECATAQTVHCASSPEVEWWCAAKLYADHTVSKRHSHDTRFETDRFASTIRGIVYFNLLNVLPVATIISRQTPSDFLLSCVQCFV
jgi:hypothetical protein